MLEMGVDSFSEFKGLSPEELEAKMRELWFLHREEVMHDFLADPNHAGRRPTCWWKYESPVPRPETDWSDMDRTPNIGDPWHRCRASQRTKEIAILIRLGVLTPEKEIALANPEKP